MWDQQIAFFSTRFRVIAPDAFGFGSSQPPIPWMMPDMASAVLEVLNHLQVVHCTLAGLSMGGYIAIPFTLSNPSRVTRLVLAHTRARADTDSERDNRNKMIEALKQDGIAALPERMVSRLLGASAPASLRQSLTQSILGASAEASIHAVTAMRDRLDRTPELGNVFCPTLVITGPEDAIIKIEDSQAMAEALPHGRLAVIPGSGHLSNLEVPAVFNKTLDEFLRQSGSG
jgi:pimeloyl-ACP methyl ester carboxylesterase